MTKYLTLLILCFAALLAGCSQAPAPTDDPASPTGDRNNDAMLRLVTKAGTSEVLNGDKEAAAELVRITQDAIEFVDMGVVNARGFSTWLDTYIMESDLEPSTKQAIKAFKEGLAEQYAERMRLRQLDPRTTAPIKTILVWVQEAANDTITFGVPSNYGLPEVPSGIVDRVELYPTINGEWAWRLVAANGKTLAHSETYVTRWSAKRTAKQVAGALDVELTEQ